MKIIYTLFPWLPGAPIPTHLDYAKSQLEDAKVRLLDERKALERNVANCDALERRVVRLQKYVDQNTAPTDK